MKQKQVLLQWLHGSTDGKIALPRYHSDLAAGMDVQACIDDPLKLEPGEIAMVPTGFAVAIPAGYEIQVRPRSGLAIKHGVTIINAPGTIDADYRGEVKIGLINHGRQAFTIQRGDRVAQLILAPVCKACFEVVEKLPESERQDGGFGHTGI